MADPFLGQIMIFGGTYAPNGWAFCNGQLLSISQNSALYAILGTTYGGDGVNNFALPDLRGRIPLGMGQGPGLSAYSEGQTGGTETVTITTTQLPPHSHALNADAGNSTTTSPNGNNLATAAGGGRGSTITASNVYSTGAPASPTQLRSTTISSTGGGQPVMNVQPYLAMNYIIALQGVFPQRP